MRVTVCQLPDEIGPEVWADLATHVKRERSELLLLPEMPFSSWLAATRRVDPERWLRSVEAHRSRRAWLEELESVNVIATEPVFARDRTPLNRAFARLPDGAAITLHDKVYLPDEVGFWEASWYRSGRHDFTSTELRGTRVGVLICTEMWFTEHARAYARQGVDLLASPRATGADSTDKWIAGGRTAAVMSGAFCLSSNRGGRDRNGFPWGGSGWVIHPEEGDVIGLTTDESPFLTVDIDLADARRAKRTYPRYVVEPSPDLTERSS